MRAVVFLLILVGTIPISFAKTTQSLLDPNLAAVVNDWSIPQESLDVFYKHFSSGNQTVTKTLLLENIIENRLIAQFALEKVGEKALSDQTLVGYKSSVANEDQLVSILKTSYSPYITESIKLLEGGSLLGTFKKPLLLTKAELSDVLSLKGHIEYKLTHNQEQVARTTRIIQYQFPNQTPMDITLWDIYERTNIQEKIALQKADIVMLKSLIQRKVSSLYILYWIQQNSILTAQELEALKQFIRDNRTTRQYYVYEGSISDVHHDNKGLRRETKNVTQEEVEQYYRANKEEFRSVVKVKARHLRVDSQKLADKVYKELKEGLNFNVAVIRYSIAEDKLSPIPGNMGWIERKDKTKSWLATLSFIPKQSGTFTAPFMSPVKKGVQAVWEIVFADERVEDYHAADSKTVRYAAAKLIASQKIAQTSQQLKKHLLADADININTNMSGNMQTNKHLDDQEHFSLFKKKHDHETEHSDIHH